MAGAIKSETLPAAVGYGLLLTVTPTLADDPALPKGAEAVGADEQTGLSIVNVAYGPGHGDSLFLISDILLMARKMSTEEGVVGRLLNTAAMNTYTVAQLFLVRGLLALDRA